MFDVRATVVGLALGLGAVALAFAQAAEPSPEAGHYIGRPIYSEPSSGLQLPPGCLMEPSWRTRLAATDYEVWVVDCHQVPRAWMLRRSVLEMVSATQARLRFVILDERRWPGEVAGESLSVQCVGRDAQAGGFVIAGAKWRAQRGQGGELALAGADAVLRADPNKQQFVRAGLRDVDCARYPAREIMMLRLQKQNQPASSP
ncbi:MAG TPA: hypothetical protein PLQ67_06305 [Burkholderiaceae bacterium]|nr:hypothetical protein [Burkholderiaceae bacterium]